MLRIIFPQKIKYLALYVVIFAIIVEMLQLLNITTFLANNNKILKNDNKILTNKKGDGIISP